MSLAALSLAGTLPSSVGAADYQVVATVSVGSSPSGMAIDGASRYAYISCSGSDSVSVLDLATLTVAATIPVGSGPATPLLSPDGVTLLVPNLFSRSISVIDVASRSVVQTLNVGRYPSSLAFDSSSSTAYAYLTVAGGDHVLDIIDPRSPAIVATITLPPTSFLNDLWISPDGNTAYLADSGSSRVLVVDLVRRVVSGFVSVSALPLDVAPTNDPNLLVVSCYGADSVSVVRRDTQQVTGQVPVGRRPYRAGTQPQTGMCYVLCPGDQTVWVVDPVSARSAATFSAPGLTGPSPRSGLEFDRNGTRLLVSGYQMSQVHAYGTDPHEAGGAYNALAQEVTVASGPTEVQSTPDGRRILVLCPSAGSVAVLEGITPLQSIQNIASEMAALLAARNDLGAAGKNIRLALERLAGKAEDGKNREHREDQGAIAKLEAGNLSAALAGIQSAIEHLEKAQAQGFDTLAWQKALAEASAREARAFIDAAVAQMSVASRPVSLANAKYDAGMADLNASRYRRAVQDFEAAVDVARRGSPGRHGSESESSSEREDDDSPRCETKTR